MSELVISCIIGHKQSFLISGGGPADDSSATYCCLDHGNERAELALKDTVEVVRTSSCDQTIAVC